MHRIVPSLLALLLLPITQCSSVSTTSGELRFAGIAWFSGQPTQPIRIRLTRGGAQITEVRSRITSVARGGLTKDRLVLEWLSGSTRVVVDAALTNGRYAGAITWGEHSGSVELRAVPQDLRIPDPVAVEQLAGLYRIAPNHIIELTKLGWGEPLLVDRRAGTIRTLYFTGANQLYAGPSFYAPAPVTQSVTTRDRADGKVGELHGSHRDGTRWTATRIDLVEEPFAFSSHDGTVRLAGTIHRPAASPDAPAVVMLGGSSWKTRGDLQYHAMNLAALGFLTVTYDQRGFGESGGEKFPSIAQVAADAIAAREALMKRTVPPSRIGFYGMSRGGWAAPVAAAAGGADFLILLVPPAVAPGEQERSSRLHRLALAGASEQVVTAARRHLDSTDRWLAGMGTWPEYAASRAAAVAAGVPAFVLGPGEEDSLDWKWRRSVWFFDPCSDLSKVQAPTLAIFAERDVHILPALNEKRLRQCIGSRDLQVATLPNAHHDLSRDDSEILPLRNGGGDEGFSIIADWAVKRFELP